MCCSFAFSFGFYLFALRVVWVDARAVCVLQLFTAVSLGLFGFADLIWVLTLGWFVRWMLHVFCCVCPVELFV